MNTKTAEIPVLDICLYLMGYGKLTPLKKQSTVEEWGFKGKCVRLLHQKLGVSESRIWHWGKDLSFSEIPAREKAVLMSIYLQQKVAEQENIIRQQRQQIRQLSKQSFRRPA
jgi:hypothetical protein